MPLRRCSSSLALALLALGLGGCKKKETPSPEPVASAAPPPAPSSSPPPTATASAASVPAPATRVTKVEIALRNDDKIVYLQIEHPNAHAAEVLNRELKAQADKWKAGAPSIEGHFNASCAGDFPTQDVFWEQCYIATSQVGNRRCPWEEITSRVWSFAGKEPVRLDLNAQMTGDWGSVVDVECASFAESTRDGWLPQKEALLLSYPHPGDCDATGSECLIPWDRLASFVKPGSLLEPIVAKAPPGPPITPVENREPPPPPDDPGRQVGALPDKLAPAQAACTGGDARACVKVAEALYKGEEVSEDPRLALRMFWKACDAGEPTGCVNLGWAYLNDLQSDQAGLAAAPYFGKACTDKVALGCLGLGTIYRDGRSTPKNPARAAELFKRACAGGVKVACAMAKAAKP